MGVGCFLPAYTRRNILDRGNVIGNEKMGDSIVGFCTVGIFILWVRWHSKRDKVYMCEMRSYLPNR